MNGCADGGLCFRTLPSGGFKAIWGAKYIAKTLQKSAGLLIDIQIC
jgi:hypothetical protein